MITKINFPVLKTGSFSALQGSTFAQIVFYERRGIMFPYGRLGGCFVCLFLLTDTCISDVAVN